MEEVCERENCETTWKHVRKNKGGPGVDGMTIDAVRDYLREHWPSIRSQLLDGTYQPQPIKRVEIPKPDGGVRKLAVPCVVDRLVQQAVQQVLQAQWDPTFSEHSYGFRPGRSVHQAVAQAQAYIAEGYGIVVDIDLVKFFNRVNQDRLMARVAETGLRETGAQADWGLFQGRGNGRRAGLPGGRGDPARRSAFASLERLVLDELDRELTRRGHRFCRYADVRQSSKLRRRVLWKIEDRVERRQTDRDHPDPNRRRRARALPVSSTLDDHIGRWYRRHRTNTGSERRSTPAPAGPDKGENVVFLGVEYEGAQFVRP